MLPQDVTGVEAVPIRTDRAQTSAYQPVSPVGTVEAVQVLHNRRRVIRQRKNGIVGTCKGVFVPSAERKNAFCECHLYQLGGQKPQYRAL